LQQDWSKAGHYEQTAVNQQRRIEAAEPSSGLARNGVIHPEDPNRLSRMNSKDVKVLRMYFFIYKNENMNEYTCIQYWSKVWKHYDFFMEVSGFI